LVQELTARIKSPRESFCRGRKMREFLFMTPLETANPVPTFMEHTLRCVLRPLVAQHQLISRRETDTCVLFFYTLILQTRQSPAFRLVPDRGHISRVSQKCRIAIPPMGHQLGSRWPPHASSPEALGTCPVSRSRQPQHQKIKER
jgi:hypothetical protein